MSIKKKPFQEATIKAALKTLKKTSGSRRFLVADEVGLGKTIVGSGVIEGLARAACDQPFSVLYVCSNLGIAKQNIDRLLTFLPEIERKSAIATVDRPSLLVTRDKPLHQVYNVYSLTPATAIPTRKGQRQDGRKEERALALVMLQQIVPALGTSLEDALRGSADSFTDWVNYYRQQEQDGKLGGAEFRRRFREALREALGMLPGQQLPSRLKQMLGDESLRAELRGMARTALAIAGLQGINPGLVIFDEFQRFRDLTDEDAADADDATRGRDRAAALVLNHIRGNAGAGPALLLLSATPYTPYRGRREPTNNDENSSHQSSDFFNLVGFLAGSQAHAIKTKKLFNDLSEELRKGLTDSDRGKTIRKELIAKLSPLMSRTERPQKLRSDTASLDGAAIIEEELLPCDIDQFCQMHESFQAKDHPWILPLWQSVPLALQTLGNRYSAWSNSNGPVRAALSKSSRNRYKLPPALPHPSLRALIKTIDGPRLLQPWAAPSLPWWPLEGGWKSVAGGETANSKLLVFSRYRAVPGAIAGLVSFAAESRLSKALGGDKPISYEKANKRRWLQAEKSSTDLLDLFHPSPFLADLEPLAAGIGALPLMKQAIEQQLRAKLDDLGVSVVASRNTTPRDIRDVLAALESRAGLWDNSQAAWQWVLEEDPSDGLQVSVKKWETAAAKACSEITENELSTLTALALDSPAVVLLRVLRRHCPDADQYLPRITSVAWRHLRTYLDKAWFHAVLGAHESAIYPQAIRSAVINGNFESVLDEHFWYLRTGGSNDWVELLNEFGQSLGLRDANTTVHDKRINEEQRTFTLRCHVAVPLSEGRGQTLHIDPNDNEQNTPLRSDEIRKAFNSPFWPNVLVTTSVGQEGIDLHPWCDALAHWDLATSPVALEQREGRITRFASLSVRRAIAEKLGKNLNSNPSTRSPWCRLAKLADEKLSSDSGLSPWWVVEGARSHKYFLAVPGSEQCERYEALIRERALYRLVLGMPDQADLMSILDAENRSLDQAKVRELCVDLCAYSLSKVALD